MSLLNLLTDKITSSVLSNNRAISSYTSTSFAQANTSLSQIYQDVGLSTQRSAAASGVNDQVLYSPVNNMRNFALSNDSINASSINKAADKAIAGIDSSALSALPGADNSLYDIQKASRDSIGFGVNSFGTDLQKINPTITGGATGIGLSSLESVGRQSDSMCTAAYAAATGSANDTVSAINNTIADKAQSSIAAIPTSITKLPNLDLLTGAVIPSVTKGSTTSTAEDPAPTGQNTTDVINQEVKIYVEGVQIPFESCSVTQSIGNLPSAVFQIPPQAGLMDIARYYQPKVHIFYTDANTGGDRLLFWGHIIAVNYARSQQNQFATISFTCAHKNALMQQVTFEWSAGGADHTTSGRTLTDNNPDQATVQFHNFNSELTIIQALQGITGPQAKAEDLISVTNTDVIKADPTKLDARFKDFESRLIGMPSVVINLWNQVKKEVFANEKLNLIFSKMYLPLVEDGLAFFDRLAGHDFLETQIQQTKQEHCNDHAKPEASKYPTMLPPSYRMDILSANQTQMVVNSLTSSLGFSGELMSFYDLFLNFYFNVEYDMITLASPSEVPINPKSTANLDDPTTWRAQKRMAIETVIKPQIPFYYAPICNVLLPNMFHTITVDQQEASIPTRITAFSTASSAISNNPSAIGLNYRSPQSIREAIAIGRQLIIGDDGNGGTLRNTTASSFNIPGKYELGRGIKHHKITMPNWLAQFAAGANEKRSAKDDETYPVAGSLGDKNLQDLKAAWIDRYGYSATSATGGGGTAEGEARRNKLNPYASESEIMAYERLLFASSDYEFTKSVVNSKTGMVECLFNPYIVPGYPMDIIEKSPNHPSFHAMCGSVTHSISSRDITTTISFLAAITYTEMSNYFIQPTHPWLQTSLKMLNVSRSGTDTSTSNDLLGTSSGDALFSPEQAQADLLAQSQSDASTKYGLKANPSFDGTSGTVESINQSIIGNTRAKAVADQFYKSVFGVGAAEPSFIFDFSLGTASAVNRNNGIWLEQGPTDKLPDVTNGGEKNDNLTGVGGLRLVHRQIESKKGIEAKFDIKFIDMTPDNYSGAPAVYENTVLSNSKLLEPGASPFLDYLEIQDFINGDTEVSGT